MGMRRRFRIDPGEGAVSPLGVAVAENDRRALDMVAVALRNRRLRLAYQPVVVAADPARIGFYEGLMRVLDPQGRVIPAKDFMGAVEAQEIGREIDCAALTMGLEALARHPWLRLSVNMSARSIGYPRWMRILRQGVAGRPGIGKRLILEITESSAMTVPEVVAAFMSDVQRQGVTFALDGFGAGHSALRYFKDFAFDILKIDGQFTRGIQGDADNQVLMAAFLSIARQFDMLCIAQGVETADEAAWLRALGMDCLQGYAFGAPAVLPDWEKPSEKG
jgi:EAL domain-containing protein (putative c-di-GMP-specific phosphodiesterase class I)